MSAFLLSLEGGGLSRLQVPETPTGASISTVTDRLYLTSESGFAEFAGAEQTTSYVWRSGERLYSKPVNFSAGIVDAVGKSTLRVFAGGLLRAMVPVDGYTTFRLPSGQPEYVWSVQLDGVAVVREIALGNGFAELKQNG